MGRLVGGGVRMIVPLSAGPYHEWSASFPLATTLFLLPLIGAIVISCIPAHRAALTRIMGVGIGVGMAVWGRITSKKLRS